MPPFLFIRSVWCNVQSIEETQTLFRNFSSAVQDFEGKQILFRNVLSAVKEYVESHNCCMYSLCIRCVLYTVINQVAGKYEWLGCVGAEFQQSMLKSVEE